VNSVEDYRWRSFSFRCHKLFDSHAGVDEMLVLCENTCETEAIYVKTFYRDPAAVELCSQVEEKNRLFVRAHVREHREQESAVANSERTRRPTVFPGVRAAVGRAFHIWAVNTRKKYDG
jgi:hypothetical protein